MAEEITTLQARIAELEGVVKEARKLIVKYAKAARYGEEITFPERGIVIQRIDSVLSNK